MVRHPSNRMWLQCTDTQGYESAGAQHQDSHRTELRCTSLHRFQAAAIFYPNFYPSRCHSKVGTLNTLVKAIRLSGQS